MTKLTRPISVALMLPTLFLLAGYLAGCTSPIDQYPPDPIGLSPPMVTPPPPAASISYTKGYLSVLGSWKGWLNWTDLPEVTISGDQVALYLQWRPHWPVDQLGGVIEYFGYSDAYKIDRAFVQGRFFWFTHEKNGDWLAVVAMTDEYHLFTENCGVYLWNPLVSGWDLRSPCWLNR